MCLRQLERAYRYVPMCSAAYSTRSDLGFLEPVGTGMQGTREAPRGWAIVDLVVRYYPRVSFARYATPVLCPWIEKAP